MGPDVSVQAEPPTQKTKNLKWVEVELLSGLVFCVALCE